MPSFESGVKARQAGIAAALLFLPSASYALSCEQTNFSGVWRAAGEGVICDFQIGNTGNATGVCYFKELLSDQRVKKVGVEGFFILSSSCNLSGALEPHKGGIMPFNGEAWAAADLIPSIARIQPEHEDRAELYLIRSQRVR